MRSCINEKGIYLHGRLVCPEKCAGPLSSGSGGLFADLKGGVICFTSDYVADEAITLVRMRLKNHRAASELARELFAEKAAQMIFVSPVHHDRALEIFEKYSDQNFSYTDCTSFAIMEALKIKEALAFDSHFTFEKFGFRQIRFPG